MESIDNTTTRKALAVVHITNSSHDSLPRPAIIDQSITEYRDQVNPIINEELSLRELIHLQTQTNQSELNQYECTLGRDDN